MFRLVNGIEPITLLLKQPSVSNLSNAYIGMTSI